MDLSANDTPLVTVGIPCFNRPEGLKRLLNSIIAQSFHNIEILVSDNCSPDPEVQRVAQRYALFDDRVKVFRQPNNIGAFGNHNFLKNKASGRFFMWAHDDDEFPENYVEVCLAHFDDSPNIILVGPSCDHYFEGTYKFSYMQLSSTEQTTYERLLFLMPYGFVKSWRLDHYFNGVFLREAAPDLSKDFNSEFSFFFALSERGALHSAPEVKTRKNTTQETLDKYDKNFRVSDEPYQRRPIIKYFGVAMQNDIPMAFNMIIVILRSANLTPTEKMDLMGRCIAYLARYTLRKEAARLFQPVRRLLRPIRTLIRPLGSQR